MPAGERARPEGDDGQGDGSHDQCGHAPPAAQGSPASRGRGAGGRRRSDGGGRLRRQRGGRGGRRTARRSGGAQRHGGGQGGRRHRVAGGDPGGRSRRSRCSRRVRRGRGGGGGEDGGRRHRCGEHRGADGVGGAGRVGRARGPGGGRPDDGAPAVRACRRRAGLVHDWSFQRLGRTRRRGRTVAQRTGRADPRPDRDGATAPGAGAHRGGSRCLPRYRRRSAARQGRPPSKAPGPSPPRPQPRATTVLEAWARGRTIMESMLTWAGRSRAQMMHSATSSAPSGASTPA